MNDDERRQWVENDEALYNDWRASRRGLRRYVRANRAEIDAHVAAALAPRTDRLIFDGINPSTGARRYRVG